MPANSTAEVLEAAADEIERSGHLKGDYWQDWALWSVGPCCAVGAIRRACGSQYDVPAVDHAVTAMERHINRDVGAWNDAPERTATEVIAALRAAADKARKEAP